MTTIPAVVGLVRALERLKSEYGGTNVQAIVTEALAQWRDREALAGDEGLVAKVGAAICYANYDQVMDDATVWAFSADAFAALTVIDTLLAKALEGGG
jgi:hypothetical protein